jgi:hypothetical protein
MVPFHFRNLPESHLLLFQPPSFSLSYIFLLPAKYDDQHRRRRRPGPHRGDREPSSSHSFQT